MKTWEQMTADERQLRANAVGEMADRIVARQCEGLGLDFDEAAVAPIAAIEAEREHSRRA